MKFIMLAGFCFLQAVRPAISSPQDEEDTKSPFDRPNLVAWCIVPFDDRDRSPQDRAAMLDRIGIRRLAYDYRAKHIPTFDDEVRALRENGIELTSWWFPTTLNDEARLILDVLKRNEVKTQLWVTGGGEPAASDAEQQARVKAEADRIRPIAEAAAEIGCTVGLYNHGGWFGEPENQIAIIEELGMSNVGIVYNQHHGHDHVERFAALLEMMKPHLLCLNLNGMVAEGIVEVRRLSLWAAGSLTCRCSEPFRIPDTTGPSGFSITRSTTRKRGFWTTLTG